MRKTKYISIFLVISVITAIFSGCGRVAVPDLIGKGEEEAVQMVKDAQLVPIVEHEYRDDDEKGKVFKTRPRMDVRLKKNSEVVMYISDGPKKIVSKNAYCKWTSFGTSKDKWGFTLPYIDKGILYIYCNDVVLTDNIKWQKSDEESVSMAEVSLTENFESPVRAKVKYEKEYVAANEKQQIIFAVPVEDLNERKPSNLSFKVDWEKNGVPEKFKIDFEITW